MLHLLLVRAVCCLRLAPWTALDLHSRLRSDQIITLFRAQLPHRNIPALATIMRCTRLGLQHEYTAAVTQQTRLLAGMEAAFGAAPAYHQDDVVRNGLFNHRVLEHWSPPAEEAQSFLGQLLYMPLERLLAGVPDAQQQRLDHAAAVDAIDTLVYLLQVRQSALGLDCVLESLLRITLLVGGGLADSEDMCADIRYKLRFLQDGLGRCTAALPPGRLGAIQALVNELLGTPSASDLWQGLERIMWHWDTRISVGRSACSSQHALAARCQLQILYAAAYPGAVRPAMLAAMLRACANGLLPGVLLARLMQHLERGAHPEHVLLLRRFLVVSTPDLTPHRLAGILSCCSADIPTSFAVQRLLCWRRGYLHDALAPVQQLGIKAIRSQARVLIAGLSESVFAAGPLGAGMRDQTEAYLARQLLLGARLRLSIHSWCAYMHRALPAAGWPLEPIAAAVRRVSDAILRGALEDNDNNATLNT